MGRAAQLTPEARPEKIGAIRYWRNRIMAKKDTVAAYKAPDDQPDSAKAFLKLITIIVPVALLGWLVYMFFFGSDPRRKLDTVEETLAAFTEIARPYVGPGSPIPSHSDVNMLLRFFDSDSRDYFDKNIDGIAKVMYQTEPQKFAEMAEGQKRLEAMAYILSFKPLSGITMVETRRQIENGDTEVTIRAGDNSQMTVMMERDGGVWVMKKLGGVQPSLELMLTGRKSTP